MSITEHTHSTVQEHAPIDENEGGINEGATSPASNPDDEYDKKTGEEKKTNPGRRKINIEFIEDKSRRHITFSKRKAGIMKKVSFVCCSWGS